MPIPIPVFELFIIPPMLIPAPPSPDGGGLILFIPLLAIPPIFPKEEAAGICGRWGWEDPGGGARLKVDAGVVPTGGGGRENEDDVCRLCCPRDMLPNAEVGGWDIDGVEAVEDDAQGLEVVVEVAPQPMEGAGAAGGDERLVGCNGWEN